MAESERAHIFQEQQQYMGVDREPGSPENLGSSSDTKGLLKMDIDEKDKEDKSGLPMASFNYVNSIIGSGIIGIAYAIKSAGFGLGLVLLFMVAFISDYTLILLVRGAELAGANSYQELVQTAFGAPGFFVLSLVQFTYPLIAMVSYNVIIGDMMTKLFVGLLHVSPQSVVASREFVIVGSTVLITLPLAMYRNMAHLAKVSFTSVVFIAFILTTILIRLFTLHNVVPRSEDAWEFASVGIPEAFGVITFAFMCHHNALLLYKSIRDPTLERWSLVTHASVGTSALVGLVFAVGGYATFTGYTQGDLLENYCHNDTLMNVSRLLFCITVMMTYPIECFVTREVICGVVYKNDPDGPLIRHVLLTLSIVVLTVLLAMTTDCLGVVLELNGLLSAIPLAYLLPSLCFLKLDPSPFLSQAKVPAILTTLFGILMIVGGFVNIALSNTKFDCSHGKDMFYCSPNNTLKSITEQSLP